MTNDTFSVLVYGDNISSYISAVFIKSIYQDNVDVILITSPEKFTNSCQSLSPIFNRFLNSLGLTREDVLSKTNSTIKLGTKYLNWANDNTHFYTSFPHFEELDSDKACWQLVYDLIAKQNDLGTGYSKFYLDNDKVPTKAKDESYHIESKQLLELLTPYLKNITIKTSIISKIETSNGIENVVLENGEVIDANFYIDCSNDKKLLSSLSENSITHNDNLIIDRRISIDVENHEKIVSYTTIHALDCGFVQAIPLQDKTNINYFFSTKFSSEAQAIARMSVYLNDFSYTPYNVDELFHIEKRTNSSLSKVWVSNCLGIGELVAEFDPIKGNTIDLTIAQLFKFVYQYRVKLESFDIDVYNNFMNKHIKDIFYFLRFIYYIVKVKSKFWDFLKENSDDIKTFLKRVVNNPPNIHSLDNSILDHVEIMCMLDGMDMINLYEYEKSIRLVNKIDLAKKLSMDVRIEKIQEYSKSIDQRDLIKSIKNAKV